LHGSASPAATFYLRRVSDGGSALRPGPPPAFDFAQRAAEIAEVKNYPRDSHAWEEINFWPDIPAGRPRPHSAPVSSNQLVFYYAPPLHLLWFPQLKRKLGEDRLDSNPPRAARAYAATSSRR
jgi:hypothetical protein